MWKVDRKKPIGIFDSGVGGLSVGLVIREILPEENIVYFADLGFSPYGDKPEATLNARSGYIGDFLANQGCKAIVVACNTATVCTINNLRSKLSIPVVGVEPGIKPAALQSKTGVIGVLATEQTLKSAAFRRLKEKYASMVSIETVACPEFVSLVEGLHHDTEQATDVAFDYILPLLSKGCDQIVLGCTHFSFLRGTLEKVIAGKANIIDTAVPVAKELRRRLCQLDYQNEGNEAPNTEFWTSGDPEKLRETMNNLWGRNVHLSKVGS
jgi:glutamate racemase